MESQPHDQPVLVICVAGNPPCTTSGGGIILRNLLSEYPPQRLTVVYNGEVLKDLSRPGYKTALLDVPHLAIWPWRSRLPIVRRLLRSLDSLKIVTTTIKLVKRCSPRTAILAVPWGGELGSELFVAAYLAHLLTRAPLIVYELDEWRASLGPSAAWISRALEHLFHGHITRAATVVWTISDELAHELEARFDIKAKVLPACVEVDNFPVPQLERSSFNGEFRLLYTGSVHLAQAEALRNVLHAIESLPDHRLHLTVLTTQSNDELAEHGIEGPRLRIERPVPPHQIPETLSKADGLLLPLSFDDGQRAVVSTSLPTKTADYLASGVPILVHAPPYATVTRLARSEGWAEIVDVPEIEYLIAALRRLATDYKLRQRLSSNAMRTARARHDLPNRRAEFTASLIGAYTGSSR